MRNKCYYCGCDLIGKRYDSDEQQIDHILPVSRFPECKHIASNHVYACFSCNVMKNAKNPYLWLNEWTENMIVPEYKRKDFLRRLTLTVDSAVKYGGLFVSGFIYSRYTEQIEKII